MAEYDWELRRTPRPNSAVWPGGPPSRRTPVAEYVALELPRESVGWLVPENSVTEAKRPSVRRAKPVIPVGQRPTRT